MTATADLEIESIAAGGDGVARHDGLVVFVPRSAPGDIVRGRLTPGRRFARARIESVVRASVARVAPRCPHYEGNACGGCQLQHLSADAQSAAKRAIVRDSMRRIGRRTIELPTFHAAPSPWRYRHRMTLALRKGESGGWFGGMHAWHDPVGVFRLDDCWITDTRVLHLWQEVLGASALLPDAPGLRGTVRLVEDRGAFTLDGGSVWEQASSFAAQLPSFDAVWWTPDGARRRRISPRGRPLASALPGDAPRLPAASFSQVNPAVASALFSLVEACVAAAAPAHVIDAYSGVGDLAAKLQSRGIRVTAIEADEEAVAYAASRLARPSRAIAARVEDVIAGLLPADAVVVNPPRAGLDRAVTDALDADGAARVLVYVSCDPATLARDIGRLPTWTVATVDAFDMFPQTAHVETVVVLRRESTP